MFFLAWRKNVIWKIFWKIQSKFQIKLPIARPKKLIEILISEDGVQRLTASTRRVGLHGCKRRKGEDSLIFIFLTDLPICTWFARLFKIPLHFKISKFQHLTINNFTKWQLGRRPQQHDYPKVSNNNWTKQPQPQPQPQVCSLCPHPYLNFSKPFSQWSESTACTESERP